MLPRLFLDPCKRCRAAGGVQGLRILAEWPLPGMADGIEAPSERSRWQLCAEELFGTGSDRSMRCGDWLDQQVVSFDGKGITLQQLIRAIANYDGAHTVNVGRLAVVEGETPSKAAKNPEIHILRNMTFFGVGYAELVVGEAALYLYERLLDEPSIAWPSGEIFVVKPEFECPMGQAGASRPSWLEYRGGFDGGVFCQTGDRSPHDQVHRMIWGSFSLFLDVYFNSLATELLSKVVFRQLNQAAA